MSNSNTTDSLPIAGRREWIGLAVIALPCILYAMDLTVLNLAVPYISEDLKPSSSELLWIVDIYGFMVAGFLIAMGNLGDTIGRRKLLMIGAGAFGIASVGAAYANSSEMLIVTRAVLGIAGATLAPCTLSLIRNMFHQPKQRTVAIGIWVSSYSVGGAMGPLIGGVLLEHFPWGSVFLIAVPVMVLLLALGPFLLPEYRDPTPRHLDFASVILSLMSVLSLIYGLKKIVENGLTGSSAACIVAGSCIGFLFLQRQKKLSDPLIDLELFKVPNFGAALLIYTLGTFVAFGNFIFTFQYMQLVLNLTPLTAGLWSVPFFLAFVIGSMLAPEIVRHTHPAYVMASGMLLSAVGFGLLTQINGSSGLPFLVAGSFIYCLGLAPIFTLTTDIIVGSAPPERAGSASAISETGSELGGSLGIAIIGSIGTLFYRSQLTDTMPPGIPAYVADAAKATLSEAHVQARQLPADLGSSLLYSANQAFIFGMQMSALTCAVAVIALAFLSLRHVRQVQPKQLL